MMSLWYLILVSQYCATNYDKYYPAVEESGQVKEMRCIRAKYTCFDERGEEFCTNNLDTSD